MGNAPKGNKVTWGEWMIIACAVALLGFLTWKQADAAVVEYVPYNMGTGLIVQHAELCFSPGLSSESIKLLDTWQLAVNQLESYERGGPEPDVELAYEAQSLFDNNMCATVAAFYNIAIIMTTEGYVLARFDEQHGFDEGTFIVAKKDILPDRRL